MVEPKPKILASQVQCIAKDGCALQLKGIKYIYIYILFYVTFTLIRILKKKKISPPFSFMPVAPLSLLFTSPLFVSSTQIFSLPPPCLTRRSLFSPSFFFSFFLHSSIPNLVSLKHLHLNSKLNLNQNTNSNHNLKTNQIKMLQKKKEKERPNLTYLREREREREKKNSCV